MLHAHTPGARLDRLPQPLSLLADENQPQVSSQRQLEGLGFSGSRNHTHIHPIHTRDGLSPLLDPSFFGAFPIFVLLMPFLKRATRQGKQTQLALVSRLV